MQRQTGMLWGAILCTIVLTEITDTASAQTRLTEHTLQLDNTDEDVPVDLQELAWLQGYWIGEGLGGVCEEAWMPPLGGDSADSKTMTGTFRLLKDGRLQFSEHFQLARRQNRWTLRLKHFDADLKGWEPQEKFQESPLIRVGDRAVWFHGVTYQLQQDGQLAAFVAVRNKAGEYHEEKIVFQRKAL